MSLQGNAIKRFQEFLERPQNRLVEEAVAAGRMPIAYSCCSVPEALLMVDKLVPVRLRAPGVAGTEIADNYLSNMICSLARSLLECAIDDGYNLMRGWVIIPSCSHMQRFFDNLEYLKKLEFSHVIDMPRKETGVTVNWLVEEIEMLAKKLSSHFGIDMSESSIKKAIKEWYDVAGILRDIGDLRKSPNPSITGWEYHNVLMASQVSPKDLILPYIREFQKEIKNRKNEKRYRARLMLVGGMIDDPEYIRLIEAQGGLVVADRFCTGSIPGLLPIDTNKAPFRALAEHSFHRIRCPRMMPDFDKRIQTIVNAVREYKVDGVVIEIIKFCDLWGVDSAPMVKALRDMGIPVLKLEREYRQGGEGQLSTRIQAFIESMGK
jgi:benzoyl-CoA reductase/2-hydroxyglutaryl-CoA dehydratase subunit BcrC/BadD/HgdB